ncbi:fimbrial protein [Burkholderia stagnalis]|uniref:fimbrial protein n=1 Tax=Burkholderia stagnalis TaxID=1503054 RepID=UPI000A86C260|nr:fimbrial protein [Burkholderia stagnalis]
MSNWAWASCELRVQGKNPVPAPLVYEAPGFDIPPFNPNVPDGTLIAKHTLFWSRPSPPTVATVLRCDPYIHTIIFRGTTPVVGVTGDGGNTYATGIGGIGMRLKSLDRAPGTWQDGYEPNTQPYVRIPTVDFFEASSGTEIELVKIGPITTGGVITGEVRGGFAGYGNLFQAVSYRIGGGIVVRPQVPTCRVATPGIAVPLGNIPASTFTGIGSVSPSRPFNIALQCSGGETGTVTNVYTTLTDHTNPGNVSDTLSLAQDSGATGIGIQVLNGNTVIKYGPDSSATGNTNQWKAGEAGNGTFTIPLTARYVQTAPKITPGTANGLATFTMSYQ